MKIAFDKDIMKNPHSEIERIYFSQYLKTVFQKILYLKAKCVFSAFRMQNYNHFNETTNNANVFLPSYVTFYKLYLISDNDRCSL